MKTIRYGIDSDNCVYGIVDDHYSLCEFEFEPDENAEIWEYPIFNLNPYTTHFTRLLPINVKNQHRKYWGLPPLLVEKNVPRWFLDYGTEDTLNDVEITAPNEAFNIVSNQVIISNLPTHSYQPPKVLRIFDDITLDKVIVFDLPSSQIEILRDKLSFHESTKHLEIKPCSWKTYGW